MSEATAIEIKNRWTGEVIIRVDAVSLRDAVADAVKSGANLHSADLRSANLRGADLSGANLHSADLRSANLRSADLSGANLRSADLSGANLRSANLRSADLSGANLRSADLSGANCDVIRDDFWAVLSSAPAEVIALRSALIEGRVDGSTYSGDCACLVGTIANARGCNYAELETLKPNSDRPAERFFLAIQKGDTPETNQASKLAVEWLDQWVASIAAAVKNGSFASEISA